MQKYLCMNSVEIVQATYFGWTTQDALSGSKTRGENCKLYKDNFTFYLTA